MQNTVAVERNIVSGLAVHQQFECDVLIAVDMKIYVEIARYVGCTVCIFISQCVLLWIHYDVGYAVGFGEPMNESLFVDGVWRSDIIYKL